MRCAAIRTGDMPSERTFVAEIATGPGWPRRFDLHGAPFRLLLDWRQIKRGLSSRG